MMYGCLKDLPAEKLMKGFRVFCMNHVEIYPGTNIIAHIRKYALGHNEEIGGEEAWGVVLKEMGRCGGAYGTPEFENEIISQSVKAVGWKEICLSENIEAVRAHFYKTFNAIKQRSNFEEMSGNK